MAVKVWAGNNAQQPIPETQEITHDEQMTSLIELTQHQNEILHAMAKAIASLQLRPDIMISMTLTTNPQVLSLNGRRHARMWAAATLAVLIDNTVGGPIAFNLAAGWNPLDLVEGARISVPSTAGNVLYQCTDVEITGISL